MKIAIINPPWVFMNEMNYFPQNIGLRYLVSYLSSKGHSVEYIDSLNASERHVRNVRINSDVLNQVGMDLGDIYAAIPKDTEVIGIGIPFTFLNKTVNELCLFLKERFPVPIISGGVLPSTLPESALKYCDYVIQGEGELPLEMYASRVPPESIKGFVSSSFSNGKADIITDLDDLPFPYRGDEFNRYVPFSTRGRIGKRCASIITSRGCPYNCDFCSTHATAGYKWRFRSPENVIDELYYLRKNFNVNHIEIEDDNFTIDKGRALSILERIVGNADMKDVSFSVPNGLRIDTLDFELLTLMKKVNFSELYLALESGDPRTLELMNKRLSLEKVYSVAKTTADLGIPTIYFVMIGYPSETREQFMNSMNYCFKLKELGNARFTTFLTRAYPGTKLFDLCAEKGYVSKSIVRDIFLGTRYQITTPEFDKDELQWRIRFANDFLNDGKKQNYIL